MNRRADQNVSNEAGRAMNQREKIRLRQAEAAEFLGVKPRTLEKWRYVGGGPPFFKLGSAVVYDVAELEAWLATRKRTSTSEVHP